MKAREPSRESIPKITAEQVRACWAQDELLAKATKFEQLKGTDAEADSYLKKLVDLGFISQKHKDMMLDVYRISPDGGKAFSIIKTHLPNFISEMLRLAVTQRDDIIGLSEEERNRLKYDPLDLFGNSAD